MRGPDGIGEPLATRLKADPNARYDMIRLSLIVFRKTARWTGDIPATMAHEGYARVDAYLWMVADGVIPL